MDEKEFYSATSPIAFFFKIKSWNILDMDETNNLKCSLNGCDKFTHSGCVSCYIYYCRDHAMTYLHWESYLGLSRGAYCKSCLTKLKDKLTSDIRHMNIIEDGENNREMNEGSRGESNEINADDEGSRGVSVEIFKNINTTPREFG